MAIHEFTFRDYQIPIVDALEKFSCKRLILIWPRRGGKDLTALRMATRQAMLKPQTIYYIFPTFSQARRAIWDAITIDSIKILDFMPDEICKKNSSEMKITFLNGSVIQFLGSDQYDRLRGTNPAGCIFSEYAYQNPKAFEVVSPILAANNGWAIFISTPQGKNSFYNLYIEALEDKTGFWHTSKLTVDDTKHISAPALAREKKRMSTELFLQEYFTSFECGVLGSIYSAYMQDMQNENRINKVCYDPAYPVHVSFDIGVRDSTAMIYFQIISNAIHIIDCYENTRQGAPHYVREIKSKPYIYGEYIVPHDIKVQEWGSGLTRVEQLENHGLEITQAPNIGKLEGIEAVRVSLRRIYIDKEKCEPLIRALNNYHYEWDAKRQRFNDHEPYHDWSSNFCDSLRYLCVSLHLLATEITPEQLERISNRQSFSSPRAYGNR